MHRYLHFLLASSATLALAQPAFAQTAPAKPGEGAPNTTALQEIVVTAQRRSENIQNVPIAVTAITADVAKKLGVTDLATLTNVVPGFTFNRQGAGSQPFIRGVGNQSTTIGNEPSIAMFVDDLYIPTSNSAMFEFNDVDSIEVLKGPQGTLFGRNATGGVIHVKTRTPSFTPTADLEAGYANYDTVSAKAYVSGPVNEKLALSLAAYLSRQSDGWGRDIYTGAKVYTRNGSGIHGKLLFAPDDRTEVLLSGGHNYQKGSQGMALETVQGFAGRSRQTPAQAGAGFYDSMTAQGDHYSSRFSAVSGKISHDFGPARLVSITGYTRSVNPNHYDISAYMGDLRADFTQTEKAFTQELQVLSPEDSKLKWILGGFYMRDDALFDAVYTGRGPAAGAGPGGANLGNAVPPGMQSTGAGRQKTESISGFAQGSYEVLPKLTATVGLRYTSDKRSISDNGGFFVPIAAGPQPLPPGFPNSRTFTKLTGRFSLDYKLADQVLIYAAFNRGFKSGIYSTSSYNFANTTFVPAVLPETIDAYTAGFKSEFFDRRMRLNVEAFHYKYANIQVQNNLPNTGGTEIRNGGRATLKGIEAELSVVPTQGLTLSAGVSIIDGKYDQFINGPTFFPQAPNARIPIPAGCAGNPAIYPPGGGGPIYPTTAAAPALAVAGGCNLGGNKMLQVIPFAGNLSAIYSLPTEIGNFDFAATWLHTDPYYFEPDNNPYTRQKSVDLVNASIRWESANEGMNVRLWVNNVTGAEYYSYIANSGTSGVKGAPAAPRTFGVTVGKHF